jgi:hypothetical protein
MKTSDLRRMTVTDVVAHQQRSFGAPRCTCKPVGAYHSPQCPVSLFVAAQLEPSKKGKRQGGKLRKFREPNQTEAEMGMVLEARRRRGEILSAEFEAITLRWGDMEYTPDYFVIVQQCSAQYAGLDHEPVSPENPVRHLVEIVYVEVKGGWKWEDSVVKFKAFRKAMTWARFELWEKIDGRWNQAA